MTVAETTADDPEPQEIERNNTLRETVSHNEGAATNPAIETTKTRQRYGQTVSVVEITVDDSDVQAIER